MAGAADYRPAFHFTPPKHWTNDPNGLVYFRGEYHLFYQHNPLDSVHGPMYWGHAVSHDLLHWEHLPVALHPDEYGMIFSGSAVVDWHNTTGFFADEPGLVAIFTQHLEDTHGRPAKQRQSLAYSCDSGRTWCMYAGNPVLASPTEPDFRDPKVFWYEPGDHWIMVLAVRDRVSFYSSPDLKSWSYLSSFSGGSLAGVWECPDLFPLAVEGSDDTRWVLEVDINPGAVAGGSGGQYFVGWFDGKQFTPDGKTDTPRWLDYGRDHYAGVSWSDIPAGDGRRLWLGWMSNWQYANVTPTVGWRGAMTVPRELSLRPCGEQLTLVQRPVREVETLRRPLEDRSGENVTPEAPLHLADMGQYLDIVLDCRVDSCSEWYLRVCASESEETLIGYDGTRQALFVDRSRSGNVDFDPEFAGRRYAPLVVDDNSIGLRVLVDRCSFEVFADDGCVSMTELVFPAAGSGDLTLLAVDGSLRVERLLVFGLSAPCMRRE